MYCIGQSLPASSLSLIETQWNQTYVLNLVKVHNDLFGTRNTKFRSYTWLRFSWSCRTNCELQNNDFIQPYWLIEQVQRWHTSDRTLLKWSTRELDVVGWGTLTCIKLFFLFFPPFPPPPPPPPPAPPASPLLSNPPALLSSSIGLRINIILGSTWRNTERTQPGIVWVIGVR